MRRNYNIYRPGVAEALMEVDNIIDKTKHEIKDLKGRRNANLDDREEVIKINEDIQRKEADLARFQQELKDILGGYEHLA